MLAKIYGITKETHVTSMLTEIATQLGTWTMQMSGRCMLFNYNRNEMIDELFKYVNSDEMSFNHGENQTYEYFNRKTLLPQYRAVLILLNAAQLNYMNINVRN